MPAELWSYDDNGLPLRGEIYRPSAAPNGRAVLVVHEADGIGGNVRRHCERLSEMGYVAAAADMHGHGRVLAGEDMQRALQQFRADPPLLRGRVRAALEALQRAEGLTADRVTAIGFCFGGWAVLELARSGARLSGVASFHGLLETLAPARPGSVHARILVATGARDPLVPPEQVRAFQREMEQADADWHLLVHGRSLHSYTNRDVGQLDDPRMAYDPEAHDLSWAVLTTFLAACRPEESGTR